MSTADDVQAAVRIAQDLAARRANAARIAAEVEAAWLARKQ